MCRACCAITGLWDRLRSMWLTDYGQCHWPTTVNVTGQRRSMAVGLWWVLFVLLSFAEPWSKSLISWCVDPQGTVKLDNWSCVMAVWCCTWMLYIDWVLTMLLRWVNVTGRLQSIDLSHTDLSRPMTFTAVWGQWHSLQCRSCYVFVTVLCQKWSVSRLTSNGSTPVTQLRNWWNLCPSRHQA